MAGENIERLNYFQRQFLGAEDFEAQQDYHRDMRRRHHLGAHSWGLVAGLELAELEQEGGGDGVDVFVMPGLAVDGFGREIVVLAPYQLDASLFQAFSTQQYLDVWIAYDDELARRPAQGYEPCNGDDAYTRVREGFRVVVEPKTPYHDKVEVDGRELEPPADDASGAAAGGVEVADLLTIPHDESVPYQELPDDEDRPRWLVRLGSVHWDGSQLIADDAGRLGEGRRYLGAVASQVLAPDGKLTLRDRRTREKGSGETDVEYYELYDGVEAVVEGSLAVERQLTVWGNLGVGTDAPVFNLDVMGLARVAGLILLCDRRRKKNVAKLEGSLERVGRVRGVEFEWKTDGIEAMGLPPGAHLGVVAQEVEKVFPELVDTDPEGVKSVDVLGLIPVLIEAVKELKERDDELEGRLAAVEEKLRKTS
jgi:hypothetical protein